jgi:hypothetical protein
MADISVVDALDVRDVLVLVVAGIVMVPIGMLLLSSLKDFLKDLLKYGFRKPPMADSPKQEAPAYTADPGCSYCNGTGHYECYSSLSGMGGSWDEPCPYCNNSKN